MIGDRIEHPIMTPRTPDRVSLHIEIYVRRNFRLHPQDITR